ncbi:class I SAM-dependent methyltransferase [Alcaligenaceae bacterium LF4-65]|jgi:SAM-dependent methyltransferase|uniref:Class I SAM-dependent methyltransferase n=1 Tax=Zwartia hollandica TaxID=324606 RepID=A0A953T296_9BURK|nr:class I SAM-dependent methyltransferase [Zwartia hollandica]MBZ1351213.1 class I SAM-dependent methyltransferase [Zwartia hollandica]
MAGIPYYDQHATVLTEQYEALAPEAVHHWLIDLMPTGKDLKALDVGAGSGRDAAWLASRGYDVWAVEPSEGMRLQGQQLHATSRITWVEDALPKLEVITGLNQGYDFILLSAVWMHVAPEQRVSAFEKLTQLLEPKGVLAITLRCGPAPAERAMYEVTEQEVRQLADRFGVKVLRCVTAPDQSGRSEISWIQMALQNDLPG